jgi:hypothetical protein
MTTITLPPDLEGRLTEEARRRGTAPELLALDSLRSLFIDKVTENKNGGAETLYDFLSGHIGTSSCSREAFSENCGQLFADSLVEKHRQGRL